MKWLSNIKIALKLTGGFGIVIIILVVIALIGYTNMRTINQNTANLLKTALSRSCR